jgi:hypothetical protein
MGFEPMNIGFANRRLGPLGYAAKSERVIIAVKNKKSRINIVSKYF